MPPKNAKGKSPDKAANTIKKKVTLSPKAVSEAITRSLAADIPSAVHIKPTPKRKAQNTAPESNSDIEILDNPPASPKKRRTTQAASATSKASTATAPKLSLAAVLDKVLNSGDSSATSSVPPPAASGRPVRTKVKTEKVRLTEEAAAEEETTVTPKATPRKSLRQVNAEAAVARDQWEKRQESASPTPKASRKPDVSSRAPSRSLTLEDDDDLPEVSELSRSPSKPRRQVARRIAPDSDEEIERGVSPLPSTPPPSSDNPFVDAEAEDAPESDVDAGSDGGVDDGEEIGEDELDEDHVDKEGAASDNGDDRDGEDPAVTGEQKAEKGKSKLEEDDENAVMQRSMWCEELTELYEDLPHLDQLCEILPYSNGSNAPCISSVRAPVEMMASAIDEDDIPGLLLGLRFVQAGVYVNTARIHPKALWSDSNRLKIAGTKNNAVGVMIGMVTDSAVISTAIAGFKNTFNVHRIAIAPAPQEYRRDVSLWGKVLGFTLIHGPSSEIGLSFSTYGEGKAPSFSAVSSPVTPSKSRFIQSVKSPLVSKAVSLAQVGQTLSFENRIPLYDGRASVGTGFSFTPEDFKKLQSWPLYAKNKVELPLDTVVALGYTVGKYTSGTNEYLSPNIQFAIVLGTPSATI